MRNTRSFAPLIFTYSLALTNAAVYRRDLVPPERIGDGWEYQGCYKYASAHGATAFMVCQWKQRADGMLSEKSPVGPCPAPPSPIRT